MQLQLPLIQVHHPIKRQNVSLVAGVAAIAAEAVAAALDCTMPQVPQ
jgi:hypothetical protein